MSDSKSKKAAATGKTKIGERVAFALASRGVNSLIEQQETADTVNKEFAKFIRPHIFSIALKTEFLFRVAAQGCECGPFPGKGKTCLEVSAYELHRQSGLESPCWPCQAAKVLAQINEHEEGA